MMSIEVHASVGGCNRLSAVVQRFTLERVPPRRMRRSGRSSASRNLEPLHEAGIAYLQNEFDVDTSLGLSPSALMRQVGQYDAIITRSGTAVTAEDGRLYCLQGTRKSD